MGVRPAHQDKWIAMKQKFLCSFDDTLLPVIWLSSIKPIHTNRFLIHVLLSLGDYNNEFELLEGGSLRNAFIKAKLLDEDM